MGRGVSELSLTLTPGSPWTPGDPDSPGSPCKEIGVKIPPSPLQNLDIPHSSFSFDCQPKLEEVQPHPPQEQAIHPLPRYLLSRGTQVSNTSWGTLWTLEKEQK